MLRFFGMTGRKKRYKLRIELTDAHRPIWREVVGPSDLSLDIVHEAIQRAMGWEDKHPHAFTFKGTRYYSTFMGGEVADGEAEEMVDLDTLLKRARQTLSYVYDFGDEWRHSVTLKETLPWDDGEIFVCTEGEGACPLEDCGGAHGHERICRYLENPAAMRDGGADYGVWIPEGYDPDDFDREAANEDLAALELEESDEANAALYDEIVAEMEEAGMEVPDLNELFGGDDSDSEERDDAPHPEPYAHLSEAELSAFRSVFAEGGKIREAEPWKDLWDQDIFGVRDPESGLLDIVSILGRNGEVYAVHVHRPPEGYAFWRASKEGTLAMDTVGKYLRQIRMIELEFLNKETMEAEDHELYERLGYASPRRGPQRWMRVRRYHPRSVPWFATPDELPPLVRGAALACRFVDAVRAEPDRSRSKYIDVGPKEAGVPESLPVFALPDRREATNWESWELEVRPVDWDEGEAARSVFCPPEFELERMAALPGMDEIWEVGAIYGEEPCMTEHGPVIPIIAATAPVDEGGQMPEPYLSSDLEETPADCVWKVFVQAASRRGGRPSGLRVTSDSAHAAFEAFSRRSGMALQRTSEFVHLGALFAMVREGGP